jgi:hypothetical protein
MAPSDTDTSVRPADAHDDADSLREMIEHEEAAYSNGHERPLGGYVRVMAVYGFVVAVMALVLRKRRLPERIDPQDIVLTALATHKLSRLLAKDSVTSPIRAPFTRYEGAQGASELREEVRGSGVRHAVGELLTCPFCLSQWVATFFVFGLAVAPRVTRLVTALFGSLALSDLLQFARSKAQQATE